MVLISIYMCYADREYCRYMLVKLSMQYVSRKVEFLVITQAVMYEFVQHTFLCICLRKASGL